MIAGSLVDRYVAEDLLDRRRTTASWQPKFSLTVEREKELLSMRTRRRVGKVCDEWEQSRGSALRNQASR